MEITSRPDSKKTLSNLELILFLIFIIAVVVFVAVAKLLLMNTPRPRSYQLFFSMDPTHSALTR